MFQPSIFWGELLVSLRVGNIGSLPYFCLFYLSNISIYLSRIQKNTWDYFPWDAPWGW